MLVVSRMDADLRSYLQQNHNQLSWKERIKIVVDIIDALLRIHKEDAIHRDLHSGNILYLQEYNCWYISDLGFCGPANKPLGSIYGNLPYIAPEVIAGKEYTKESDIYSVAMLMWEISSGQQPFISYKHDYDLAMDIINGRRPKIVPGTPLKYKTLMEKCWNLDPSKRPDTHTLWNKIMEINKMYHQDNNINDSNHSSLSINFNTDSSSMNLSSFNSKIYNTINLSDTNKAYHSIQNDLGIPENIASENNFEQDDLSVGKI
ncbi:kinase-like domain-containing protein [Glomus cerebriforme]|uniref:Kinase-like domain-containing protein n=1 Tax=Glomus cerebriforme TaxID=658196 RepID=A0A397T003_9GLOM|nr:kinase-like domain-containing protein [Glomus cerebriforme]